MINCNFVEKYHMGKDLTISEIERQNILNNQVAIQNVQQALDIEGMLFEGAYRFTKQMVADYFEISISTVDRYLEQYSDELRHNGYVLIKGKRLKDFKLQFGHIINEATKTTILGLFDFRSFLNMGMLITGNDKAKALRSSILDIVISTINEKTGGGTKYINRRDPNYVIAAVVEENYRKNLTSAINECVSGHETMKYAQITDYIYKAVFKENAKEYREILKLSQKDNVRHTLYSEVLLVISSFENGVGAEIRKQYENKGNERLAVKEVERIVQDLSESPMQTPYLNDARTKMASRDLGFRDAYHGNIAEYLRAITPEEYERFIGSQSVNIDKIYGVNIFND